MNLRKQEQIPAIASLSSPQFDAKALYAGGDNVPDKLALTGSAEPTWRWRPHRLCGNLPDIRIKFSCLKPICLMRF
jgi:hypothetical protein